MIAATGEEDGSGDAPGPVPVPGAGPTPRGPGRVLLVSADPAIREACDLALAGHRVVVTTVRSGVDAVIHARLHALDLLLIDAQLPDVRGEEVLHWLRSVAGARDRPILFLAEAAHPAAQLAGVLTLRKPLSPDRLQAALGGLLRPPSRPGGDAS